MAEDGNVIHKPENLTFAQAAALTFGGSAALYFLKTKGNIQPGESVLIIGASGCVGSAAVQLAKHFGAKVTAVCSTTNVDLVRSVGADQVIDYTNENIAQTGAAYDVVFDTVGAASMAQNSGW
jgi:NADPH:quinone reductase-like Zn-dependent oxidoreductase